MNLVAQLLEMAQSRGDYIMGGSFCVRLFSRKMGVNVALLTCLCGVMVVIVESMWILTSLVDKVVSV